MTYVRAWLVPPIAAGWTLTVADADVVAVALVAFVAPVVFASRPVRAFVVVVFVALVVGVVTARQTEGLGRFAAVAERRLQRGWNDNVFRWL